MNSLRCLTTWLLLLCIGSLPLVHALSPRAEKTDPASKRAYLGFDRNIFPGKEALPVLRKTFTFSGYWLSPPPGEKTNTWRGHRELLRAQGFGFLLLYRGPQTRDLKNEAAAEKSEGFPALSIIFLDIEEGGRLPRTYHAYLRAWASGLSEAGFRSGAYCSGIPVKEQPSATITTVDDIRTHAPSQDFVFYIFNDVCPPSPGCAFPQNPPSSVAGRVPDARVWQFAQSPRRMERTVHCPAGYHTDGNCYAPGDTAHTWFLDVNSASSPDPSSGR
jgi:hypothetical protein